MLLCVLFQSATILSSSVQALIAIRHDRAQNYDCMSHVTTHPFRCPSHQLWHTFLLPTKDQAFHARLYPAVRVSALCRARESHTAVWMFLFTDSHPCSML
ncbi:hypothetical protein EDD16DRAFT_263875 [Pisolithus croceorrhizus]|nr:hypothetical protein EDD16DRAFT_263875 [Pisolithus croceorrhizus]